MTHAASHDPAEIDVTAELERIGFLLEDHSAHLIRLAHQRATFLFQRAFEGSGVTPTQFAILASLSRHGAVPQNVLSRITAIDTATLSPMLRRLTEMGYIRRTSSPDDQRVNLVRLTPDGTAFTLKMLPVSLAVSRSLLAPLRERERDRFIALLRKVGNPTETDPT
jgi:MarR family transcriptional regulator, lower aerobic nicotinate degradation pathway regulator